MTKFDLPDTDPKDSPESLWSLQLVLLSNAEVVLGPRDPSKKICQPVFVDDGPRTRHTPNRDGVYIELSRNGERYWPTVMFEMAHETVHLLNPTIYGNSNYLEEGTAVEFSLRIVRSKFGTEMPINMSIYRNALELIRLLPGDPLDSARSVREHIGGPLSNVTASHMKELFPGVDSVVLDTLVEKFVRE